MTIYEKYYAMNKAINTFLVAKGYSCRVFKYGTAPGDGVYPYIQTTYRVTQRQPHGTSQSGTLTNFEYSLNFFTAPKSDRENDAVLFVPFEAVREAVISPREPLWAGIANVYDQKETPEFTFKGGLEVLQKGLIFACQTVVSHIVVDEYTTAPIEDVVDVAKGSLNYE
jgi:hypothetical protein